MRTNIFSIGRIDAEAETPILGPPDMKNWLIGKDPDARKDWMQEQKGTTEDEMVEWHHQLEGHEFEQAPGVVMDREAWQATVNGVAKHITRIRNWTDSLYTYSFCKLPIIKWSIRNRLSPKLSLFPKAEVSEHALWPVLLAAEQKGMKCKRQQLLGEILLPWTSQAFEYQVTSGALWPQAKEPPAINLLRHTFRLKATSLPPFFLLFPFKPIVVISPICLIPGTWGNLSLCNLSWHH